MCISPSTKLYVYAACETKQAAPTQLYRKNYFRELLKGGCSPKSSSCEGKLHAQLPNALSKILPWTLDMPGLKRKFSSALLATVLGELSGKKTSFLPRCPWSQRSTERPETEGRAHGTQAGSAGIGVRGCKARARHKVFTRCGYHVCLSVEERSSRG